MATIEFAGDLTNRGGNGLPTTHDFGPSAVFCWTESAPALVQPVLI